MKKIANILSALLLTAVGASAQTETTAYKFVCTDWSSIDSGRVSNDNISYDEASNTITVNAGTGANNVALSNGLSAPFTTASYTVTNEQHWFIVVGTNLSTTASDSYLWWMDGANDGENWVPTLVQTLSDGQVLFAWDLSLMLEIDGNLQDETNYLDGWTGFGLTSTTGTSVISDINFYTTEDAITTYSELEGVLQDATPYTFVCTDWVSLDTDRLTNENITPNEDNTITVNAGTGANNVALGNSTSSSVDGPFTTANYYVTNDQCWFVVVGTNLATGKTETNNACDSYLWWMDGANWGSWVPTEVAQSDDGTVMIAWDLSTMDAIDVNLQHQRNRLDGWTGFGLTSTTGTSVISNINFYTYDEMIEAYPELDQRAPYTFEAEEWIVPGDRPLTTAEYNSDGTITVTAGGNNGSYTNDIALGNMNSMATTGSNTANKYITSEQTYFVIIGSDLSTTLTDNALWWMNGVLRSTFDASGTISLDNDQTMVYWDLSSELTAGEDGMITLEGGTCFGLTSTASSNTSTISYIGFYTKAQLDAASNGVEWEMTSAGWGTLILPFDAEIPTVNDDGDEATLTLYAGSALSLGSDGTTITVSDASTSIVANTPYLVSGTAGTYTFTGTPTNTETSYTVGMLTGTLVDMKQENSDFATDGTQYVLQNHEGTDGEAGEGLAFYPITSSSSDVTLEAYHCYLTLENSTSGSGVRAFISLPGSDNEETGIVAVESETLANDAIYDLSGRRVSKAVKGVYIQNGKKVLVK